MNKTITIFTICWLLHFTATAQLIDFNELETDSVTDVDGNVYKTILFDDTWWMAENLRTKHYNDGTEILQMTELMDASDSQNDWSWWSGAGRWGYPDFDSTNFETYGLIYSWDALTNTNNNGVCPEGWSLADTGEWFDMARLIVSDDNIVWEEGTRNTPDGGTETYNEVSYINKVGRYLKSDNGILWTLEPTISQDCNGSGMNITPNGEISTAKTGFGTIAELWTPNYVHSDSSGQGRRYILFNYDDHKLIVTCNHRARLRCARCTKHAHIMNLAVSSITLDSTSGSCDTVGITANYYWAASTNASWFTVTQSVDSADGKIIVKTESANTSVLARTDTVFVTMDDSKTKTILVTQAGKTPLFSVSDTSLNILADDGSTTTFSVSSNTDWTIGSSESWLTPDVTSGSGNTSITLKAEANSDTISRSATITIESTTADTLVEITVLQAAKTIIVSSINNFTTKELILYPNPVNKTLNIISENEIIQVDIITISGKIVKTVQQSNTVDMQSLSSGLYLVKITTENGLSMKKILKQ